MNMKTIEMRWFNDRKITVNIYFNTLNEKDKLATVLPQDIANISFVIPEDTVPLIKTWEYGGVLIWADKK